MTDLSVPSSRVKQSNKNVRNSWVCSYGGNGVGSDRFSENKIANRVSGAWRNFKRKREDRRFHLHHSRSQKSPSHVYWSLPDKIPYIKCHVLTEEKLYKTEAKNC